MSLPDINALDIATLDSDGIAALIGAGESVVECREKPPKDGSLAPSVAAYANSGGRWLLVGVNNAGEAVGWTQPGRSELCDWLRTTLGAARSL